MKSFTRVLILVSVFAAGQLSCAQPRPEAPEPRPQDGAQAPSGPVAPASGKAASEPAPAHKDEAAAQLKAWCEQADGAVKDLKWNVSACEGLSWEIWGHSVQGRPLVYASFGDPAARNTTLVFSMVHGDEVTPLYVGLKLAQWMRENQSRFPGTRIVIAPLVNPDSFYRKPRTRTNARGVDVNRNLPTADWNANALKFWKTKFSSNPRRYPGRKAGSEPETEFQVELIKKVQPQKILSIHAPLNFMDYDGPSNLTLARFPKEYVRECLKLRSRLKAVSGGFFPGSLGNYAGQERGIPTLTLELPTANADKADLYWQRFSTGIQTMIEFAVPDLAGAGRPDRDEKWAKQ